MPEVPGWDAVLCAEYNLPKLTCWPLFLGQLGLKVMVFFLPSYSQIQCRFFVRGNGLALSNLTAFACTSSPDEAPSFDPLWPESMQLASVSEVVIAGI